MNSKDIFGVFIIETLSLKNEQEGFLDGEILSDILNLCDIPNEYYYIRTSKELENIIIEFEKSAFRYIHFSCHANTTHISFTFEDLTYKRFAKIINGKLKGKRLFISACKASNFNFAKTIIPVSDCYSIIGSPNKIDFDKSAVFWSGFYHLMNEYNDKTMSQPEIKQNIQDLVNIYKIPINYYSFIRNNKTELKENLIRPNRRIKTIKIKIKQNE